MYKLGLWGQNVAEYCDMFGLSQENLKMDLLEYGCGPTAINVELRDTARSIISCDPLFRMNKQELSTYASKHFETTAKQLSEHQAAFDFSRYGSLDALLTTRRQGLATFFSDYELGQKENRYQAIDSDHLPFADFNFDLALSSHYLFDSIEDQDLEFHMQVICELASKAKEVRIFPLIDHLGQPSPLLGPVLLGLQTKNYGVEVREVTYHLQPAGNAMLRVWAQQCQVTG